MRYAILRSGGERVSVHFRSFFSVTIYLCEFDFSIGLISLIPESCFKCYDTQHQYWHQAIFILVASNHLTYSFKLEHTTKTHGRCFSCTAFYFFARLTGVSVYFMAAFSE